MDQCFRIAVWMFCLVGYLQAAPVTPSANNCSVNMDDLFFELDDAKCENVTFTYPTNVPETKCFAAAWKYFEKGFGDTVGKCDSFRLNQTKEELKDLTLCIPQTQETCNLNLTVHGKFANFVTAAKTFVQALNNNNQVPKK